VAVWEEETQPTLVVYRRHFGTRGCGAGGRTARAVAQQPTWERGFFAAITRAWQGEASPRAQGAYPAGMDSNTATQAAASRLAKRLSSPYPAAAQRGWSPSSPARFGKTKRQPGRSQPHPSEAPV